MVTQIISFILSPNEYGGPVIDLQKVSIMAKTITFSDEGHFDLGGYVM